MSAPFASFESFVRRDELKEAEEHRKTPADITPSTMNTSNATQRENQEDQEEWCLPQRTGTRRYTSTLQSLFWRYEQAMENIDAAAQCAKRRYENAKALCTQNAANSQVAFGDDKISNKKEEQTCAGDRHPESKETRAQLRLVRHYALQRSLLHAMCLSLVYAWRTVLYCVRAISDAPVPTPLTSVEMLPSATQNAAAHTYAKNCYSALHENCRDCSDLVMQHLIDKCQHWIKTIESVPSVRSLHEDTRAEILEYLEQSVVDKLCICRAVVADGWIKLMDYCDRKRIERGAKNEASNSADDDSEHDVALQTLRKLTGTLNGGTSIALCSRSTQPPGRLIDVSLPPLNVLTLSRTKSLPVEVEERRLLDAMRAIGGSGDRKICRKEEY